MKKYMDVCLDAARAGGQILLDMRGKVTPREKSPKDLVTEADFAAQEAIRKILLDAFPDHGFMGEEDIPPQEGDDRPAAATCDYCWIVDPLDGTMNYVHQLPNYSVSIALRRGRETIIGAVLDPVLDECFAATLGNGATLNGSPIHTSPCRRVDQALIAASLSSNVSRGSLEVRRLVEVLLSSQAIRRLGSAALNLCYVAMGRLDGYWATCVKPWDVAAGQLIVREAGGVLTRDDGSAFDLDRPRFAASATAELHEEFLSVLRRAGS